MAIDQGQCSRQSSDAFHPLSLKWLTARTSSRTTVGPSTGNAGALQDPRTPARTGHPRRCNAFSSTDKQRATRSWLWRYPWRRLRQRDPDLRAGGDAVDAHLAPELQLELVVDRQGLLAVHARF